MIGKTSMKAVFTTAVLFFVLSVSLYAADEVKAPKAVASESVYEFTKEIEGVDVVHEFSIKNEGADVLNIEDVKAG